LLKGIPFSEPAFMSLFLYTSTDHFVLRCLYPVGWAMWPVKIVPEMTCVTLNLITYLVIP